MCDQFDDIWSFIDFDSFNIDTALADLPQTLNNEQQEEHHDHYYNQSCLAEVEQLLMNDDDIVGNNGGVDDDDDVDGLIDYYLLEGDDVLAPPGSNVSDNGEGTGVFDGGVACESGGGGKVVVVSDGDRAESNVDDGESSGLEKEKGEAEKRNEEEDASLSKKRLRQIRNRDSASKSRERRKSYVKDLELKSKYFEGECTRLQRVLQGCIADNHALHLQLQNDKAIRVFMAKQESAVLLKEPLLLGSLLWLMGVCLFAPLLLLHLALPANKLVNEANNDSQKVVVQLKGARSERTGSQSFILSRGCKGSRSRMRDMSSLYHNVTQEAFG